MSEFRPSRTAAALLAGVSILSTGCGTGPFKRKTDARVFVPPPPAIRTMPEMTPPMIDEPPELELSWETDTTIVLISLLPTLPMPPAPPPPAAPKAKAPAQVTSAEVPPPAPERPKLAQIFTQDEVKAYNREIDEKLERVRGVLALAAGKNLTGAQRETVAQIRSLQGLAEQARRQDLVTAVDYARRADLLANDLAGRLP